MARFGLVTPWYPCDKGWSGRTYHAALSQVHEVRVLAVGPQPARGDGWEKAEVTHIPSPTADGIRGWAVRERLESVLFNQHRDWSVIRALRDRVRLLGHLDLAHVSMDDLINYRQFEKVLSYSYVALGYLERVGVPAVTVPLGLDTEAFDVEAPSHKGSVLLHLISDPDDKEEKNTDAALRIFLALREQVADVHLLILTRRPWTEFPKPWQKKIEGHKAVVVREGALTRRQYATILRTCDLMLHPCRWASTPVQAVEAMMAGLPVLTIDAPPNNEHVVHGEYGYVIPGAEYRIKPQALLMGREIDQAVAVQSLVEALLDKDGHLQSMKEWAREYALENYTLEKAIPGILEAVE